MGLVTKCGSARKIKMPGDEPLEERLRKIEDESFEERLKRVKKVKQKNQKQEKRKLNKKKRKKESSYFPIEDDVCNLVFYIRREGSGLENSLYHLMCFNPFAQPNPKKPFFRKISKEEEEIKNLVVLKNAVAYVCGNCMNIIHLQDGKKEKVEFENQPKILCRFQENYLVVHHNRELFLFDIDSKSKEKLDEDWTITCASSFEDKIAYCSSHEIKLAEPLRGIFKTVSKKKRADYKYLVLDGNKLFYGFIFSPILPVLRERHYRICMYDMSENEEKLIFKGPDKMKFIPFNNLFIVWKRLFPKNIYKIEIRWDSEKGKERLKTEKIKFSKLIDLPISSYFDLIPFKNQNIVYYTSQKIGLLFVSYSQKGISIGDVFMDEYARSRKEGGIKRATTYEKSRSGSSSWIWLG